MPELPDVETFKRYFDSTALHKKVRSAKADPDGVLEGITAAGFARKLNGRTFRKTRRHGKHLFVDIGKGDWFMLHFGMTGYLKYYKDPDDSAEYQKARFELSNGYHLGYSNRRKLGKLQIIPDPDDFIADHDLGPDPIESDLSFAQFRDRIADRRGSIKAALMNQSIVAGLGNVYSDEILFRVGIDPHTKVEKLGEKELHRIFRSMYTVLGKTIEKQADPEEFPRSYLTPHREPGATCPKCGGTIEKVTVSGRSAYYCPDHQRRGT
jgi:formamidopyrimidine-DNA glycosylase